MQTQDAYDEYCSMVRNMYCDEFWRVFGSVYQERAVLIDRVLKTTREVYVHDRKVRKKFPISVRDIRDVTKKNAGDFTNYLMHEVTIDLRSFALPGNVKECKFRFINPLWAWTQVANDMIDHGHEMHFVPKILTHEQTGDRVFGAGVQFGNCLKFATSRTPRGGKPALFGISFDGGESGVAERSVYPICISALNFNGADPRQCGLVGFLPIIKVSHTFKATDIFRDVKAHVMQECVGAVLDVMENVARDGFTARIGKQLSRFHPFLVAVRVDSKERKTYFGLKSDRSVTRVNICIIPIYDTHI